MGIFDCYSTRFPNLGSDDWYEKCKDIHYCENHYDPGYACVWLFTTNIYIGIYIKISSNKSVTLTNKPSNSQYVYYYNKKRAYLTPTLFEHNTITINEIIYTLKTWISTLCQTSIVYNWIAIRVFYHHNAVYHILPFDKKPNYFRT